jgi:hypothetical protein
VGVMSRHLTRAREEEAVSASIATTARARERKNYSKAAPESHEGREYPKSPTFPKSLASPCVSCVSVSPVSEGQGGNKELEKKLAGLARRNACTRADDATDKKRFKLARDLAAVQKRIGRDLTLAEIKRTCDKWEGASTQFLGWDDDNHHFTKLLAELTKVRVPTGEGDTLNKTLETVFRLSLSQLPQIPGYPGAPESWRRIAALHRELSRPSANGTHFLTYRDAAKACVGLRHQQAYDITGALVRGGVIKIVKKGKAGLNSGKAAEFRYLLPQAGNGTPERKASGGACRNEELPF